jgi:hypothetical protein
MIFTNPSGKRGAVSASKKNCATTSRSNHNGRIISILVNSISSTSPRFNQYSCDPSSFDSQELLSAVTTKEQRCLRNKEILMGVFG